MMQISFALDERHHPVKRQGSEVDYYLFAYGHDYFQALKDFYNLTGETPLLPRYALGNWWSRYWKYTEESYLSLIEQFKDEKIPLSVSVIDMDWHLTEVPERLDRVLMESTTISKSKTLFESTA